MTTELHRPVKRRTRDPFDHHGRRIVVILRPGDYIGMREEGRRKIFWATIPRVFRKIVEWNVAAEHAEKQKQRKLRRLTA